MIKINGLHKYFNKGKSNEIHVINGVDLNLEERGMVAIFGKSGCGKTTLLNVIGGLDRFADGNLEIDGKSICTSTDDIRNQYIGYIFQNYNLNKAESCFDNVADALRLCGIEDEEIIRERVMAALTNVGMEKYVKRTPDTLSGGQQQRIAIARAIVKNPRIILADEPTGNLDEANTVMIMDLLKAISKDHLVLLVTHEANLVDYYCDTVIELSDGKIVGVRNNTSANGFAARDKNAIYLGELEKTAYSTENADIEFYGPAPDSPIKLTLVNNGGRLYIKLGSSSKVQILDETSEVCLVEGVYEEAANANSVSASIDMSKLPRIEGTRFGHLFSFKSSVKSGYTENFKKHKKGKKLLKSCMMLFSAVVVLMTSFFGTAFDKIIDADNAYNHNVFYVYAGDAEVSKKLNSAIGSAESGIDYISMMKSRPYGDINPTFLLGGFETFEMRNYESNFQTNAVLLGSSIASDLELVEGKRDGLSLEEVLISTHLADALLEKSTFDHISEYSDLIGMVSNSVSVDGKNIRIAGIIESKEKVIYLSDLALAKYYLGSGFMVRLDSDYGETVPAGELMLVANEEFLVNYPSLNETIMIRGKDFKLSKIKTISSDYLKYLESNGIKKLSNEEYYDKIMQEKYPDINQKDYYETRENVSEEYYFNYLEYYYAEYEDYLDSYVSYAYNQQIELWLYGEKGIKEIKYVLIGNEDLYRAEKYKEKYGEYPTSTELYFEKGLPDLKEVISQYVKAYENEYYTTKYVKSGLKSNVYLVCESDYIELSRIYGESHKSIYMTVDYNYGDDYYYEEDFEIMPAKSVSVDIAPSVTVFENTVIYAVIHSTDPELTYSFLEKEFSDLVTPQEYLPAMLTPDQIYSNIINDNISAIITSLISMAIILALMSVCMYFIMRSSLMNRIKEVGVYRAIGVSKKNLVFKFSIEALVLATLTVFVGYLITSTFIFICLGDSSLVASVFFYPVWLAALVLVVLYALSLFCGILPILMLLRKTPSEILAKYDI